MIACSTFKCFSKFKYSTTNLLIWHLQIPSLNKFTKFQSQGRCLKIDTTPINHNIIEFKFLLYFVPIQSCQQKKQLKFCLPMHYCYRLCQGIMVIVITDSSVDWSGTSFTIYGKVYFPCFWFDSGNNTSDVPNRTSFHTLGNSFNFHVN